MKKILVILVMMLLALGLFSANTLGTVTTSTIATVYNLQTATTTVADSTLLVYSSTFQGRYFKDKIVMVLATVITSFTATSGYAPTGLIPTVYISVDGTNWVQYAKYTVYQSATKTAGTTITFPVNLVGVLAPYVRIGYTYYSGATEYATANTTPKPLAGAIKTQIVGQ